MLGRLLPALCAAVMPTAALAQPITHPIWATTPKAEEDEQGRAQFIAAVAKRGLPPAETVLIPLPTPPATANVRAQGMTALRAAAFEQAAHLLGEAARQALATGGAGLAPGEAASLFLHQGMAIQLASGTTYSEPFTEITPPDAKLAYLRAAVLGGGPELDDAASSPLAEASWRMAKQLATARPRTQLTVKAHARATVSLDGRPALPSPATIPALTTGEHFVLVEEPGHAPWSVTLNLDGAANEIEVPATPLLLYEPAAAAARARAQGATFALVGQLHLAGSTEIDLRLVDAKTSQVPASSAVALAPGTESPDLVTAVLRLDELAEQSDLARRTAGKDGRPTVPLSLASPPPPAPQGGPRLGSDTKGWLRLHWPVATAIGAALGATLALGIVVAKDGR